MKNAQIQTLESFQSGLPTSIARLDVNNLRPVANERDSVVNALLERYEWEEIDAAVVRVARSNLVAVSDILDEGLIHRLGGLGTLQTTYEQLGDMDAADVSMDGETPGSEDSTPYTPISLPVPIIHKDFRINIRTLEASRRLGDALDTVGVETATRKVNESVEAMLMNGTGLPKVGANQGQGFTNKTQRSSGTAASYGGGDFGTEGNGYKTVNGMINALKALGFNGPFGCYVARTQYGEVTARHTDGSGLSELQAILNNVVDLKYMRPSDNLAAENVVVVNLNKETVDIAIATDLTTVQWVSMGGMVDHFKVMTALVPRVKHDSAGNCGVAHATAA